MPAIIRLIAYDKGRYQDRNCRVTLAVSKNRRQIDIMIGTCAHMRGAESCATLLLRFDQNTEAREMPKQSALRIVKRWKRYEPRENYRDVPAMTRGFYVLYENHKAGNEYEVRYIGIGGLGGKSAIASRIKSHHRRKPDWTHFSYFEVHDNISAGEIREMEQLLLAIFADDSRIRLTNIQKGSRNFREARKPAMWIAL
jgi:hypothetical protein